eukprot:jgi/Chlat1/7713/Chrsp66S00565
MPAAVLHHPSVGWRGQRPSESVTRKHCGGAGRGRRQAVCSAADVKVEVGISGKRVLVAGATGRTGREVVRQLGPEGADIMAFVRDRSRATALANRDIRFATGDVYNYEDVQRAMQDSEYVICATGATPSLDPTGPFQVDYEGTMNLVAAAKAAGVKHVRVASGVSEFAHTGKKTNAVLCTQFVLVTSLGTSQLINPLNLFWGILFWKKQAELYLQRSGLSYTIVRPGGLKDELRPGEQKGNIVMRRADTLFGGGILRSQVAEVCVEALMQPAAANKIVEIIASTSEPATPIEELFARV